MRRRRFSLFVAVALAVGLPIVPAAPAVAATLDSASVCVDGAGDFRFTAEVTEPTSQVIFRLGADSYPFTTDAERFAVNFDPTTGSTATYPPRVETFGAPPFDRWVDGPVAEFTLTDVGGASWLLEGTLAPGTQPFAAGDTVWGVAMRPPSDVLSGPLLIATCAGLPDLVGGLSGPASAEPGENISGSIEASITNSGTEAVPSGTTAGVDLVLSTDEVVPPGFASYSPNFGEDVLLLGGRGGISTGLDPGETKTVENVFGTIPADTPDGDYFLCIRVDPGDGVAESDEGNNVTCSPITIGGPPAATQTTTFDFDIVATTDVPFHLFNVLVPGTMKAVVEWTGASTDLTVQLTGRRRPGLADPTTPYAEVTGTSPLTLTYDVTAADVGRGTGWRIIIRDAAGASDAEGTITLTTPFDPALTEQFENERIRLKSGDLWPGLSLQSAFLTDLGATARRGLHGLITLSRACNCQEQRLLGEAGFHQLSFLPDRSAYGLIERGASPADPRVAGLISFLTPLEPEDKVDPHLLVGDTHHFRIHPAEGEAIDWVNNADGTLNVAVKFAKDTPTATSATIVATHAISATKVSDHRWEATVAPTEIVPLAENEEVEWITAAQPPSLPTNADARAEMNVDDVQDIRTDATGAIVVGRDGLPIYDGLAGNGITVAVSEGGTIDATHPDLANVVNAATEDFSSHKTHVAGIVGASGLNSDGNDTDGDPNGGTPFEFRGMAPRASLFDTNSTVGEAIRDAIRDNSVDLLTRSTVLAGDGNYSDWAAQVDEQIRGGTIVDGSAVPRRPVVWAMANEGGSSQYTHQVDYFSSGSSSKNALVIGSWWADGDRLSQFSGLGPTYDGRIQPLVIAPGSGVHSTDTAIEREDDPDLPGNRYSDQSGTSMATPATAGVVALMLEAWQTTYSDALSTTIDENPPLPSTVRAILVQTATDVDAQFLDDGVSDLKNGDARNATSVDVDSDSDPTNGNDGMGRATATVGPDFTTGFGLVNATAAVDLIRDFRTADGVVIPNRIVQAAVAQASVVEYGFVVADSSQELKVTLAWDDVESAAQAIGLDRKLINDLDLELVGPDGTVFYPWQLGQSIVDDAGVAIPDAAQTPGTPINVVLPITPSDDLLDDCTGKTDEEIEDEELECNEDADTLNDYVPADALSGGGAWVARRGRDHLNNVEQVVVDAPATGRWIARVVGFDIRSGAQDFSLVGMPYPDLPELQLSSSDKVGIPAFGTDISFDWQVINSGAADTGVAFDYKILLSTDFVIGDDVELTDTAGPGTLGPLAAGASALTTSTVQISQADADTLLGTTGTTVQDLLDNDVFLIVQADTTDTVLEHDEPNAIPIQAARVTDVVLVYDRSGSMAGNIPISTGGNRQKVEMLKDSARVFYDLMRLDAEDRLGSVSFSGSGSINRDFGLTAIGEDNIGTARGTLALLVPNGATDIRGALQEALDMLPSTGADERRRVIVFFSDGEATDGGNPTDASFLTQFDTEDVKVFSVGLGTPGGSGYAGIDVGLLQTLSNVGDNGFFLVTDRSTDLDKFFVNALAGAVDWETIIDPTGTLSAGEATSVDVGVTEEDTVVYFIATWDNPAADLELSIRTPSGAVIDSANFAAFGNRIEVTSDPTHQIVEVRLPLQTGASDEHQGTWQLMVSNPSGPDTAYSASAMAETTVRGEVTVAEPADGEYTAGDAFPFSGTVSARAGAPIGDATVTIFPEVPLVGLGDVLTTGLVSPAELAAVPTEINGDALTLQERMVIALRNRYGTNPIPTGSVSPFTLNTTGPGSFSVDFTDTRVTGPYTFTARASFRTEACADATRETSFSIGVEESVHAPSTPIRIVTGGPADYIVTIVPRDVAGGYVGPGHVDDVTFYTTGPLVPASPVFDNLDGSYSQIFTAIGSGPAEVGGMALDTHLIPVPLSVGAPIGGIVLPGGGGGGTTTPIVIVPGPIGKVADVVGVTLRLNGNNVALPGVEVTAQGTVHAIVPSGLAPGVYDVVLETADGANAPSATSAFEVIGDGQTYPAYIGTLEQQVAALAEVGNGAAHPILLDLLREWRAVPTSGAFDEVEKATALDSVLRAIIGAGAGDPATTLLRAIDLTKIDARFFDVAPSPLPVGSGVVGDFGFGIVAQFDQVVTAGVTTFRPRPGPSEIDPQRRGTPYVAYDLVTTAKFVGEVTLTFPYREGDHRDESSLRVLHLQNGEWQDVTQSLDTGANTLTAKVASLSPFVIVEGDGVLPPPTNLGPTAEDDSADTDEDTAVTIDVAANDSDPEGELDRGSVSIVVPPEHGVIGSVTGGEVVYSPDADYFGADGFQYVICDRSGLCDGASVEITVAPINDPPVITTSLESQTVQYSDGIATVTIMATDVDSALTLEPSPAPNDVVVDTSCVPNISGGEDCTWTLTGTAQVGAGTYEFFVGDGEFTVLGHTLFVIPEDAVARFHGGNPVAVRVDAPGSDSSDPFEIEVRVLERLPDEAGAAPFPGDIASAAVSVELDAVGQGPGVVPGPEDCEVVRVDGARYDEELTYVCSFEGVPVNTYSISVTVDGGFYQAYAEDVLVVFDPSLGFSTGGGSILWPGTGDLTTFGFTMQYNRKGKKVQGALMVVRHLPDGTQYRIKSNALYGLALGDDPGIGWASFSGKATFAEPGFDPVGNHQFLVHVEDRNEPGTGIDRFWIETRDKDGQVVGAMSLERDGPDNAVDLDHGNIVVPHS